MTTVRNMSLPRIRLAAAALTAALLAGCPACLADWVCPACGASVEGDFCLSCGLMKPPEGMAFIPEGAVLLNGEEVTFEAFFIDSAPASYRQVLPWLNATIQSPEEWAMIVTGQYDDDLLFLKFTPFTGSSDRSSIVVPASCFDLPAASFTWEGARHFLSDQGKRLPTRAELLAAWQAGLVDPVDTHAVMGCFESVMVATLGTVLGSLDRQAMFMPGNSSPEERLMWEWTRDAWLQAAGDLSDLDEGNRTIMKPLDPPVFGFAGRNNGYFNVIFRGVVAARLPGYPD
ncbi:hypothetical protein JW921_01970 [Candidatus Fermentibacterales bacterium]|nr:hypothetical protein [Candidatus Fermentibacterales bacterium]